jgi:hypothetical protein
MNLKQMSFRVSEALPASRGILYFPAVILSEHSERRIYEFDFFILGALGSRRGSPRNGHKTIAPWRKPGETPVSGNKPAQRA